VSNGVIRFADERAVAREWIDRLKVKTPSAATPVGSLSGGNQQKVVLAKWRIAGLAVILLGDTLEEVIGLSSRILVMKDGAVTASFEAPPGAKPAQVDLVGHMV
jgi:ribose transport system ATP-binding protein